jgi:UDP-2,4-diacetamido-2,4,6-trideoxy-beta-L-altropyranose hydrolase
VRALVLTEGSEEWGNGHLTRCLGLAQHLSSRFVAVSWLVRGDTVAEDFVGRTGAGAVCDWFSGAALEGILDECSVAIVDSYHAPLSIYGRLAERVRQCLWLDDDGRLAYPPGVVVNPNAPDSLMQWCSAHPATRLLSGYEHQILRAEFFEPVTRLIPPEVRTVLVMLGGTDPRGLTGGIIEAVRAAYPHAQIESVAPQFRAQEAPLSAGPRCRLHVRLDARGVRELMEAADLAVCAAGQTLCEACRLGLPTIAICVAENQVRHAAALAGAGAVKLARWHGTAELGSPLPDALRELAGDNARRSLSASGARLIDGRGVRRIVSELLGWSQRLELRAVRAGDSAAIWAISNHPSVRAQSVSKATIAPTEHAAWYAKAIADPGLLFLGVFDSLHDDRVAGQLRYRVAAEGAPRRQFATVSISFDPSIRGHGEAARILREGDVRCFSTFPLLSRLEALVADSNGASQRSFLRAGYARQSGSRTEGGARYLIFSKERGDA